MSLLKNILRYTIATLWYIFAASTVLTAAGFGVARLLLPMANEYTDRVELEVRQMIGYPVEIKSLDARWIGFTPTLVLKEVRLFDKEKSKTIMHFPEIRLGVDIFDSVAERQIMFSRFDLVGANLFVVRDYNGEVKITGLEIAGNKQENLDENKLKTWIFGQDRLSIELDNLIITDKFKNPKIYHFTHVALMLRNQGDRHLVDGIFKFPGDVEKQLTVSVDASGDFLDIKNWTGSIYVNAKKLPVTKLLKNTDFFSYDLHLGVSDIELWLDIQNSNLAKVQGDFSLSDVQLSLLENTDKSKILNYNKVGGKIVWKKTNNDWQFNLDDFSLTRNKKKWPNSTITMSYKSEQGKMKIDSYASFFRVEDVMEIINSVADNSNPTLQKISELQPKGDIHQLFFHSLEDQQITYRIAASLRDISVQNKDGNIIEGISGAIEVNERGGTLRSSSESMQLTLPRIFDNELSVGKIVGDVSWKLSEKEILLSAPAFELSNKDVQTAGALELLIPVDDRPLVIDLAGDIKWAKGDQVPDYLPTRLLSVNMVKWLNRSIENGVVTQGSYKIKGPLDQFPFKSGNGIFEIKFHVTEGQLNYAENWPVIRHIDADVLFHKDGMKVTAESGVIFNSRLTNVEAKLVGMFRGEKTFLDISGDVQGKTQDKFDFLLQSPPLNRKYGEFINEVVARGDSKLHMNIRLDFMNKIEATVTGELDVIDNDFDIRPLGNVLAHTSGQLRILKNGLQSDVISTNVFGKPSTIKVDTVPAENNGLRDDFVVVHADGEFNATEMSRRYMPVLQDLVSGESKWKVDVNVPLYRYARNKRGDKGVTIDVNTFLQGVDIRLPQPFGKKADDKLRLVFTATLMENNKLQFRTRYGGYFDSLLRIDNNVIKNKLRGEIRFGSGQAVLPNNPGLNFVGQLEEFSVDIWKSLIQQIELKQFEVKGIKGGQSLARQEKSGFDMSIISAADTYIKKFTIFDQQVKNLHLVVTNDDKELQATLDSVALKGIIGVPHDLENKPLKMDLDYWHLNSAEGAGGGAIDPRSLPAIQARSKQVTYMNRKFGSVSLETTKLAEGLRLEKLYVNPRSTSISAFGKWVIEQGKQNSQFEFHLDSKDLGETMVDLGYKNSLRGGKGNVDANMSWSGSLINVNLADLQGKVHFSLSNGRLLEYDPLGGASLLGLFSIQTLPRRLLLDFSDLFDKGLSFDSIKGDLSLEDGDAFTKNFTMDGSNVSAVVAGRIGLNNRDYDQLITVKLHVADIASFIGLLIASPWTIIIPQLLKEDINAASTLEYTLTGTWETPVLTPVVKDLSKDFDSVEEP